MKRFRSVLPFLILVLSGCSRNDQPLTPNEDDNGGNHPPVEIVVSRSTGQGTGADPELATAFKPGCLFGLTVQQQSGYSNVLYKYPDVGTTLEAADPTKRIYWERDVTALTVDAFYPYKAEGYAHLAIEQNQNATNTGGESNYYLSDVLHATTTLNAREPMELKFHHTMSKLLFNVTVGGNLSINSLMIENQPLSAAFTFDTDGKVSQVSAISSERKSLTAYATSNQVWRSIVIPQSNVDLTVKVLIGSDTYAATLPSRTFEAGKQYQFGISVKNQLIITPQSITTWTDGGGRQEVGSYIPLSGKGIESNPYLVGTFADFKKIQYDLSAYYKQTAHIDMKNEAFSGIGGRGTPFTGTYDGGNLEIKNVNINQDGLAWNAGLFQENSGKLIFIKVTSGQIQAKQGSGGVICGANYGTIQSCHNDVTIMGYNHNIGGICGVTLEGSTIQACTNTGNVMSQGNWNNYGGICGLNQDGVINWCTFIGTVSGEGELHNVICGGNYDGAIINCTPSSQNTQ